MQLKRISKVCFIVLCFSFSGLLHADVTDYFNGIKQDPNALYAFFKEMPKGGELHYHLLGGVFPETLIQWLGAGNYCVNPEAFTVQKISDTCPGVESAEIFNHPKLYEQLVRSWSMKNFIPGIESREEHFFATFGKFGSVVGSFEPQLLADIMKRAADQHELYLEIMELPGNEQSSHFARDLLDTNDLAASQRQLLNNPAFQKNIHYTVDAMQQLLQAARSRLDCGTAQASQACHILVRFQVYVLRDQPLKNVFAQALNGFAAASRSDLIVGINLVQAEDGLFSLRDYQRQMQVFSFLHTAYPNVHIALHAGELNAEAVTPESLRFHIRDALFTGHAERIGHGVAIRFEDNAEKTLNFMAEHSIPVEINLTSNKKILNVFGQQHPLHYYLNHHVPVILSTDDEGILRTDLTRQYVEAAFVQHLDYSRLKQMNRNALTYSFLPGKSIWQQPEEAIPVMFCQQMNDTVCLKFIQNNLKARLQWQLEQNLSLFEKKYH